MSLQSSPGISIKRRKQPEISRDLISNRDAACHLVNTQWVKCAFNISLMEIYVLELKQTKNDDNLWTERIILMQYKRSHISLIVLYNKRDAVVYHRGTRPHVHNVMNIIALTSSLSVFRRRDQSCNFSG